MPAELICGHRPCRSFPSVELVFSEQCNILNCGAVLKSLFLWASFKSQLVAFEASVESIPGLLSAASADKKSLS